MSRYSRPKTVRFEPETWRRIEMGALYDGVTTSEYIRSLVEAKVGKVYHPRETTA